MARCLVSVTVSGAKRMAGLGHGQLDSEQLLAELNLHAVDHPTAKARMCRSEEVGVEQYHVLCETFAADHAAEAVLALSAQHPLLTFRTELFDQFDNAGTGFLTVFVFQGGIKRCEVLQAYELVSWEDDRIYYRPLLESPPPSLQSLAQSDNGVPTEASA